MGVRMGLDVGGTFTDVAAVDLESGALELYKTPSTPRSLAKGAAAALKCLGERVSLGEVEVFAHGTTAGTNALLEGTGARTALLTTQGFRDLLEIARQRRPSLYDLSARKPKPLVPRRLRREVRERMGYDGTALVPVDLEAVVRELAELRGEGVEALAICFLHCYANPSHERAVRDLAKEVGGELYVTASSDLLPRFREYERLSTTVVNAYLGPLMNGYLDEFAAAIRSFGIGASPHLVQSNGGTAPLEAARRSPASTVLSGPAAGAAAAAHLCAELDLPRAISMDMGGTSTDVCLLEGGTPAIGTGRTVGGYAVELPGVDVRCIGAGGGSMLSVDPAGLPQVGPQSAGAHPGPACYGEGGERPTLTDAFLLLGRLGSSGLLGGALPLDREAAEAAMERHLASPLGVSVERAAMGALELAVAGLRRAVDGLTVAEGRDPREFILIAAGGAGPMVACELARELDIREVVVPRYPGNFSAFGLLVTDLRRDWVETRLIAASPESMADLNRGFSDLEREAREWLEASGVPEDRREIVRRVAARYVGQDYELETPVADGELGEERLREMVGRFHRAHEGRYGYSVLDWPVEFVDIAVTAIGRMEAVRLRPQARGASEARTEPVGSRRVFLGEGPGWRECSVYDRARMRPEEEVEGPGIIEQYDATTYLPAGYRARVEGAGNLRLKRDRE